MALDHHEEFDYEQVIRVYAEFADVRFKLLAFVPSVAAIALAFVDKGGLEATTRGGLGVFGFLVTLGIVMYDQRNTQFYNGAIGRAQELETKLGLPRFGKDKKGGLFNSRQDPDRLFGFVEMRHDRGLALVYSAAFAAWSYLALSSFMTMQSATAIAVTIGLVFFWEFERLDRKRRPKKKESPDSPTV